MNVGTLIEHIDLGQLALPEFQRGYVWNRDQVRQLMSSLYRRYPVGSLMVWTTAIAPNALRGVNTLPPQGSVDLLLDGQQRITSLYGIVRGHTPRFFQGNGWAFQDLKFNIQDESFEFWQPVRMRDNPVWFDVTELMKSQSMAETFKHQLSQLTQSGMDPFTAIGRLQMVQSIKNIEFHIERISGEDKTIDVVVEIFNRVNSGGTRLSKGDLALARICAQWPEARERMNTMLKKWSDHGYHFKLDWLLRCVTTVATGDAFFTSLSRVDTDEFKNALDLTETYINRILNLLAGRLGIDHGDVLKGVYAIPLMTRYLHKIGGTFKDSVTQDNLLYWYLHVALWGRYSGSTETVLNQDLRLIEDPSGAIDRLIAQLRQQRGDLKIRPEDFHSSTTGSRFYPFLYVLTRVNAARDLNSGLPIKHGSLGKLSRLELHHVFPKARLYKAGYSRSSVNAVANFMFQTQASNLQITNRHPEEYFSNFESSFPGVLESQWIPKDTSLWTYDRYEDFLDARRELLATAANQFLDTLLSPVQVAEPIVVNTDSEILIGDTDESPVVITDEDEEIERLRDWMSDQGLPLGERHFEITDEQTGDQIAQFDIAWPDGLQEGLSQPLALLIEETEEIESIANQKGFMYFTDVDSFMAHVAAANLEIYLGTS